MSLAHNDNSRLDLMWNAIRRESTGRAPQETPLYHLVEDHFDELERVWDERCEREYGFWRLIGIMRNWTHPGFSVFQAS